MIFRIFEEEEGVNMQSVFVFKRSARMLRYLPVQDASPDSGWLRLARAIARRPVRPNRPIQRHQSGFVTPRLPAGCVGFRIEMRSGMTRLMRKISDSSDGHTETSGFPDH